MSLALAVIILLVAYAIVTGGNRYHDRKQTRTIVKAIEGLKPKPEEIEPTRDSRWYAWRILLVLVMFGGFYFYAVMNTK